MKQDSSNWFFLHLKNNFLKSVSSEPIEIISIYMAFQIRNFILYKFIETKSFSRCIISEVMEVFCIEVNIFQQKKSENFNFLPQFWRYRNKPYIVGKPLDFSTKSLCMNVLCEYWFSLKLIKKSENVKKCFHAYIWNGRHFLPCTRNWPKSL